MDQSLRSALEEREFELAERDSRRDLNEFSTERCDLLIIEVRAAAQAIDLLKKVRAAPALRKVLTLVTAEWGTGQATLALANGADAFEPAPIDASRLVAAVEKLLRPRMVMTAKASTREGEAEE
jgi:DNA-binding response OmpR family regulator